MPACIRPLDAFSREVKPEGSGFHVRNDQLAVVQPRDGKRESPPIDDGVETDPAVARVSKRDHDMLFSDPILDDVMGRNDPERVGT